MVGTVGGEIIVFALFVLAVFGAPSSSNRNRRFQLVRDFFEMLFTMAVMTLAAFLALTPFVSAIAFEDVGRTVLGSLTIFAAFQLLGRIGMWRWKVWDGRERIAARTGKPFPNLRRVVIQASVLFATLVCLFAAVVSNSDPLTLVALGGVAAAVLLGISVDVFDASRQERTVTTSMSVRQTG